MANFSLRPRFFRAALGAERAVISLRYSPLAHSRGKFPLPAVSRRGKILCISSFSTSAGKHKSPVEVYEDLVKTGKIRDDLSQRNALVTLQELYDRIFTFESHREETTAKLMEITSAMKVIKAKETEIRERVATEGKGSWFYGSTKNQGLFGNMFKSKEQDKLSDEEEATKKDLVEKMDALNIPQGLYMYGGPGSGKTFLMDLFFDCLPVTGKRRVHFNEFMLEIHRTLHQLQKSGYTGEEMMERCVSAIHEQAWLLCFDEFQVTDIADAMVMRRLFEALLERGMVIVATSNREPDELYKNGIQRDLFIPFIEELKKYCFVTNMQSEIDYRMLLLENSGDLKTNTESTVYFVNDGKNVKDTAKYERVWEKLTRNETAKGIKLRVQGREINVPKAAANDDIARFSFDDLCGKPLGPADYYAIASTFHTVFIDNIPQLSLTKLNQMRRFITLIDNLYDQKVVVIASAAVEMDDLIDVGGVDEDSAASLGIQETDLLGTAEYVPSQTNVDEVFAFDRTISRLHEMQKPEYLEHVKVRKSQTKGTSPVRFFSQMDSSQIESVHSSLSEADIKKLWDRYDTNNDGQIDSNELKTMLQEITLYTSGHKHVPKEVLEATRNALYTTDGKVIDFQSFSEYFTKFGITCRY